MTVLTADLRRQLERAVVAGRGVAQAAALSAISRLGVGLRDAPSHLSGNERALRAGLRARARQLGDPLDGSAEPDPQIRCRLLIGELAYEQWHRILFARFLAENSLLRHPDFGVDVSLLECEELAHDLGEPDGWSVAARFASQILPGIFSPSDPCAAVRLAREDLLALERVLTSLPPDVFTASDSLGWVYQSWQSQAKTEVNASGRKIGGADLAPVTQLFTEDYMVRFLLENSLGAWWAVRRPDSSLIARWEFLRTTEDGCPVVGPLSGWPERVANLTVMDPCCGSGHFLVVAFEMLWRMLAEEDGLADADAQDAVLRNNLFGLELDARCAQIAMFALALEAWKSGGFRALPVPNVACSGTPASAPLAEWTKLADGDVRLEAALTRLHGLFLDADTIGSLIDPVSASESAGLESVDWDDVAPLLELALTAEAATTGDPASEVFGEAAAGLARAASFLSRRYTLLATNVPYLKRANQDGRLAARLATDHPRAAADLATAMHERCLRLAESGGAVAAVAPQGWTSTVAYADYREDLLRHSTVGAVVFLGPGSFTSISGEVVNPALSIVMNELPPPSHRLALLDVSRAKAIEDKSRLMVESPFTYVSLSALIADPESRVSLALANDFPLLAEFADCYQGMATADYGRFGRCFWEVPGDPKKWSRQQSTVEGRVDYGGRQHVVRWDQGHGELSRSTQARIQGLSAWGESGVAVSQMGEIACTLYTGEIFDNNTGALIPKSGSDLLAIWAFVISGEYSRAVRQIDRGIKVTNAALVKVPFDVERWRQVAAHELSEGLPVPYSAEPTQWLFSGDSAASTQPLQVAVARLVGFRWPDQTSDGMDAAVDADGIVCLPAIAGEQAASERVRSMLAASYGRRWSATVLDELLQAAGGRPADLDGWLRDVFFKEHCRVFHSRPFVWHVWDGRRDGFSALVNFHRLDRANFEKLTYTTLGWWIDRQRADSESGVPGAEARLAAATELQRKLALILEGDPPFDIYVRWKPLAEQPLGWDPDLDDGVRLNIRPFVEAGVLRSRFAIHWRKDRGANPDGSERHNDRHYTLAQKRAARKGPS